jgi:hypothetical protein
LIFNKRPQCQLHCFIGKYTLLPLAKQEFRNLRLRVRLRTRIRNLLSKKRPIAKHLGEPSRFSSGTWVRILDETRLREMLDENNRQRGLLWAKQQWPYAGTVHRVFKPVRRMMDDTLKLRPIARTVLIDTVACSGVSGLEGCGRKCPMMFRDEWLEEVEPPVEEHIHLAHNGLYASVRSIDEIKDSLDSRNSYHGLMFMPEMYQYSGQRYPILHKVGQVWGPGVSLPVAEPVYILDGLHCTGSVVGDRGPCDRGCRLLWHEKWLRIENS